MRQWVLPVLATLCLSASVLQAQSIYKQEVFAQNGFSSTFDPNAVFAFLAADNFTLGSSETIGQVRWWGNGDGFGSPNLVNFTSFTAKLHPRLGNGLPGPAVYSETFATGATNPVDTGLLSFNNTKVWQQTATLTTPQTLLPGQYFVSVGVQTYVDNHGAIWFWNTSNQGDGFLAFDNYDGAGWRQFTQPLDLSFELIAVPEPGSIGVISIMGAICLRRAHRTISRGTVARPGRF